MADSSRSKQTQVGAALCGTLAVLAGMRSAWKTLGSSPVPVAAVGVDQPNPAPAEGVVEPTTVEGWPVVVVPAEGGVYCSPDLPQGCVFFEPTSEGVTQ